MDKGKFKPVKLVAQDRQRVTRQANSGDRPAIGAGHVHMLGPPRDHCNFWHGEPLDVGGIDSHAYLERPHHIGETERVRHVGSILGR